MTTHNLEFAVSLRVSGDDLAPSQVSIALGCEPSEAISKGQEVPTAHFIRKAPTGVWLLRSPVCTTIDEGIEYLLDRVTDDKQVWETLGKRYRVEMLVGVFSKGEEIGLIIQSKTLNRIARLGLALSLDIYCNSDATSEPG